MENNILLQKMIAAHSDNQNLYSSMKRYYEGKHDIYQKYRKIENRVI